VPAKRNRDLIRNLGKRLREIPELEATQVLPADIERHLQLLKRAESGEDARALALSASDASEQSA